MTKRQRSRQRGPAGANQPAGLGWAQTWQELQGLRSRRKTKVQTWGGGCQKEPENLSEILSEWERKLRWRDCLGVEAATLRDVAIQGM